MFLHLLEYFFRIFLIKIVKTKVFHAQENQLLEGVPGTDWNGLA